jgi:hypothetical protein
LTFSSTTKHEQLIEVNSEEMRESVCVGGGVGMYCVDLEKTIPKKNATN